MQETLERAACVARSCSLLATSPFSLPPTKKAISSSKSMKRQGPYVDPLAGSAASACSCPQGRRTSVPDTTTELDRPW